MSDEELENNVAPAGNIMVVASPGPVKRPRKRKREVDSDASDDEASRHSPGQPGGFEESTDPKDYLARVPDDHVNPTGEINFATPGMTYVREEQKSDVQRLLEAKHRRRRLGRHLSQAQMDEDLEDVKRFLAMTPEDKRAYLSIFEYDGTNDNMIEGLAKASSLALRAGLAYVVEPDDYDLATLALEMPEVKDSLATIWDCVDLDQYAGGKMIKAASAIGHIGDTLLSAAMKLFQGVRRASDLRKRAADIQRRRSEGIQSVFDQRAVQSNSPVENGGVESDDVDPEGEGLDSTCSEPEPPQVIATI